MITGVFNENHEARINLVVRGPGDREETLEAIVDTGYNGFLTLSPAIISSLELPWLGRSQALFGDGSTQSFDVHEATILWEGDRLIFTRRGRSGARVDASCNRCRPASPT